MSTEMQVLVLYLYLCIPTNFFLFMLILLRQLPLSPVEMQAVAGCPLLPHVNVLPHGAVTAAGHGADSSQDTTGNWILDWQYVQRDNFPSGHSRYCGKRIP